MALRKLKKDELFFFADLADDGGERYVDWEGYLDKPLVFESRLQEVEVEVSEAWFDCDEELGLITIPERLVVIDDTDLSESGDALSKEAFRWERLGMRV